MLPQLAVFPDLIHNVSSFDVEGASTNLGGRRYELTLGCAIGGWFVRCLSICTGGSVCCFFRK